MDVHPELAFRLGHLRRTSLIGRIMEWSGRRSLERADTVVALGNDMAARLEPHSNGNTEVVRTWADGDRIRPHEDPEHPLRSEWGWDGKFVVAYSGNMGLVHEFDTILDAATELSGDERYLFCFIGDGPRSGEVAAEAERRGLKNVCFRDFVPEEQLGLSLTAPDLHLVTLRNDLAGLSVPSKTYGALAAGKPVAFVGPSESDIASLVTKGNCGIHVRNGDASSLVEAIHAYRESPREMAEQCREARRVFESEFTIDHGLSAISTLIVL